MFFLLLLCILLPKFFIKYACCIVYVQLLILPTVFLQQSCSKSIVYLITFNYHFTVRNKQFSDSDMKNYMNYVRPFVHFKNNSELQQLASKIQSSMVFDFVFIFQPHINHLILVFYHIIYQLKSCQKEMRFYMIGQMREC